MSELMDTNSLESVEAELWEQVRMEGGVAVASRSSGLNRGEGGEYTDTRGVLADFYEDCGNVIIAGCLRWCILEGRICYRAWFNGDAYSGDDRNNLPVLVFTTLRGSDSGLYRKSNYSSMYPSTKEAYEDLSLALVRLGR